MPGLQAVHPARAAVALQQAPPLHTPERQELLVKHDMPALPGTMLGAAGAPGRGVAAALALLVLVGEGLPLLVGVGVALPVAVPPRRLGVEVAVSVPLRLPDVEGLGETEVVAREVVVGVPEELVEELKEALCEALEEGETDELALVESKGADGVWVGLVLAVAVAVAVRLAAALCVGDREELVVPRGRGVMVERNEGVVVPAGLVVLVGLGVAEPCD